MDYGSAHAYAATFLSLVHRYAAVTGDDEFAREYLPALQTVASAIARLQDRDELVWAKPRHRTKHLRDDAESYRGLRDWQWLLRHWGWPEATEQAGRHAARVRQGLEQRPYDPAGGQYLRSGGPAGPPVSAGRTPVPGSRRATVPVAQRAGASFGSLGGGGLRRRAGRATPRRLPLPYHRGRPVGPRRPPLSLVHPGVGVHHPHHQAAGALIKAP